MFLKPTRKWRGLKRSRRERGTENGLTCVSFVAFTVPSCKGSGCILGSSKAVVIRVPLRVREGI